MSEIYYLDSSVRIKSSYQSFYKELKEKEIIDNYYQLFPIAFLVGINERQCDYSTKTSDLFTIKNLRQEDLEIIKAIALLKLDVKDANELLREIMAYADGGIKKIKEDYENDGELRLDKYID